MLFKTHPNEGEAAVTTMDQAQAYCKVVVPEGFGEYTNLQRLPHRMLCCHCGAVVCEANSVPMGLVQTLRHSVMIQQHKEALMYIMAFHCATGDACSRGTSKYLKHLLKTKVKPTTEAPADRGPVTPSTTDASTTIEAPADRGPVTPSTTIEVPASPSTDSV